MALCSVCLCVWVFVGMGVCGCDRSFDHPYKLYLGDRGRCGGKGGVCVGGGGGGGTLIATVNNNVHLSCAHQRPER